VCSLKMSSLSLPADLITFRTHARQVLDVNEPFSLLVDDVGGVCSFRFYFDITNFLFKSGICSWTAVHES
jgi:hypothetical protein